MTAGADRGVPFADQLRRHREAAGLTQEELAERAGLTTNAVAALERGRRRQPYPHTVRALAAALDLSDVQRTAFAASVPRRGASHPEGESDGSVSGGGAPAGPGQSGHGVGTWERGGTGTTGPTEPESAPAARPLPAHLTRLIGREREAAALDHLLSRDGVRLLTLCGPGGVGKTRLAVDVAARAAATFPDGVVFVPLAPLSDPVLVPSAIAQALGLQVRGGSLLARLGDALRDKRLLLVLDNFEHVLAAAPTVPDLLASCPDLKALVTSRAALRVRGEQEFPVAPLGLPDLDSPATGASLVDKLLAHASVQLFVERGQAVRPDFVLSEEQAPAVAEICTRLDGLPLAIELAAARLKLLPPRALLARLQQRLDVLAGGPRDLPARQQTMRATIQWSHDLLQPEEQALFRRLAVFADGCTLESAEEVCSGQPGARGAGGVGSGGPTDTGGAAAAGDGRGLPTAYRLPPTDVLDGLASLVEKSLVHRDDMAGGEARFSLLWVMREFGLERLAEAGEAEILRRRHAAHFTALAEAAGPKLMGPDQTVWLIRLAREHDNLAAAIGYLLAAGDGDAAVRLAWPLWRYWWVRGHHSAARRWMDAALQSPITRRAEALLIAGSFAWSEGDDTPGRAQCEKSLALFRDRGNVRGQAIALMMLGLLAVNRGDGQAAGTLLEEGLHLFRAAGELWGAAMVMGYLGHFPFLEGQYAVAARWFEESRAAARAAGDGVVEHQALYGLGLAALAMQHYGLAADRFREGLALALAVHDVANAGYFVMGLAGVAAAREQPAQAARLLAAGTESVRGSGSPPSRYGHVDAPLHARTLATARAALGDDAFDRAWAEGKALTPAQAAQEAAAGP